MTGTATIEVRINGKDREVARDLSVSDLLQGFDLNPSLVVVELNGEILERELYNETLVKKEDVLELVHFVGGG
jgi:thiamine biosynthesis protein ThiS